MVKTCYNMHVTYTLRPLFNVSSTMIDATLINDQCWETMMCALQITEEFGFFHSCLTICEDSGIRSSQLTYNKPPNIPWCHQKIKSHCPSQPFIFPPRSLFAFPHNVQYIYNRDRLELTRRGLPEQLCFNATSCSSDNQNTGIRCLAIEQFGFNDSVYFDQFHTAVIDFFSGSCRPKSIILSNIVSTLKISNVSDMLKDKFYILK